MKVQPTDREAVIDKAVEAGKFPRSRAQDYMARLEKGGAIEAATRKFIEDLPGGIVPSQAVPEPQDTSMDEIMASFGQGQSAGVGA